MTSIYTETQQVTLQTELDRVYSALARYAGINPAPSQDETCTAQATSSTPLPNSQLTHLIQTFGLSAFEADVLLLCAGVELENRFVAACTATNAGPAQTCPTFALALSAFAAPHWSALSPDGPLRRWDLLHADTSTGLLRSPLRIEERILHFLMGAACSDGRLKPFIRHLPRVDGESPRNYKNLARQGACLWNLNLSPSQRPQSILLIGRSVGDQQLLMQDICALAHLNVGVLHVSDIPGSPAERESLARAWTREALLTNAALYIRTADSDSADPQKLLSSFLSLLVTAVALEVREGSVFERLDGARMYIPAMDREERKLLWTKSLGPLANQMNGYFDRILDSFDLDASAIRIAGSMARNAALFSLEDHPSANLANVAWTVCKNQARRSLDSLAHRIEPKVHWSSLVLPEVQLQALRQIVIHARRRHVVQDQWGFSQKYSLGSGVSALFSGSSGTGKTMAAQVIAKELSLDLYQIDLASTMSKYIGETEKHLRLIFDAADESGAVLLFDEADALFSKRSEVTDSHDRYANLQVSYLLQRMESYRGVAILTTNMKQALDTAFLRRLRFIVQFPFPDVLQRESIWQRVFPEQTPVADLDYKRLAQLNIPGGIIRNIATHAAFLAAEEDREVQMEHILRASRTEYAKIDKPLTATETGGWL